MLIRKLIASIPVVRHAVIRTLKMTAKDVELKNPWTGDSIYLNSFKHKTYWFYRRSRESETMQLFQKYISAGDTVLEVGGHIGFITQYFSHLVGKNGKVIVFEPGLNNYPYIERNTRDKSNVKLEKLAISKQNCKSTFYEDNISGQNNSLLPNYKGAENVAASHKLKLEKKAYEVYVTSIDEYVEQNELKVDFIKIDIEGNELNALSGAKMTLDKINALMVEVTENHELVSNFLLEYGFNIYDEYGENFRSISFSGNVFAVKQ